MRFVFPLGCFFTLQNLHVPTISVERFCSQEAEENFIYLIAKHGACFHNITICGVAWHYVTVKSFGVFFHEEFVNASVQIFFLLTSPAGSLMSFLSSYCPVLL